MDLSEIPMDFRIMILMLAVINFILAFITEVRTRRGKTDIHVATQLICQVKEHHFYYYNFKIAAKFSKSVDLHQHFIVNNCFSLKNNLSRFYFCEEEGSFYTFHFYTFKLLSVLTVSFFLCSRSLFSWIT